MVDYIIISLTIFFVVIMIVFKIKKMGIRKFTIELIILAEQVYEHGQNDEKFNYVFDRFYQMLPKYIRFWLSKKMIETFIQKVFDEIKLTLDYKK